ncbi:hypothetical protein MKZ38_005365 [Zalerion maritima]|uniref:Glycoside hydrolase family 16 protein n=1 Tax=Zalerion maritima TaxID=339359 RepID=A0AAD5WX75_9PEZI|nr:hypothetical protein MKZ38_005365 [Zalerion maritima]
MALTYSLATSYIGSSLLDGFQFWDTSDSSWAEDPSNGFVQYYNRAAAEANNLTWIDPVTDTVRLAIDTTNTYDPTGSGRPSVRLESTERYDHGLFIGDFSHIPSTQCGVWPAFWMYGPDWPNDGELDIIEGGSNTTRNQLSAHTSSGCSIPPEGQVLDSTILNDKLDCVSGDGTNRGCSFAPASADTTSYGMPFNAIDGGVYAVEWTSEFIKMWHFARPDIPEDIGMDTPDPSGWGMPQAIFGGSTCNPDTFFSNMRIVININMCGDWPGIGWGQWDTCDDSDVNYIKVYQAASSSSTSPTSSTTNTAPATITGSMSTTNSCSMITLNESTSTTTETVKMTLTISVTQWPTPTPSEAENPLTIGEYAYMGCLGTDGTFSTWTLGGSDDAMTVEKCVNTYCASYRYAGAYSNTCYCANELGGDSQEAETEACDIRCPGNLAEFCGGGVANADEIEADRVLHNIFGRDAPSSILLSIYGAIINDIPMQAPGMGGSDEDINSTMTMVTTVIYTTVCPTNNAMLATSKCCTNLAVVDCGCPTGTVVPIATFTQTCNTCRAKGENAATLVAESAEETSATS